MATLVYSVTQRGYAIYRGNTLGLGGNPLGVRQTSFISLDPTKSAGGGQPSCTSTTLPGCPAGTTLRWQENGSFSDVPILPTSTVTYAALIWAGDLVGDSGVPTTLDPNTPITFKTPLTTTIINPNPLFSFTTGSTYTRGAVVTDLIKAGGSGIYSVSGVPSFIPNVGTGWTLAIVFEDSTYDFYNISVFVDNQVNRPNGVTIPLAGFLAPPNSPVNARVLLSAQFGDSGARDEVLLNGSTLSGPKNSATDFFASQIVDENGNYYNSSFNYQNTTPGLANTPYGRIEYDITNVDGTGRISPNSTSATLFIPNVGEIIIFNSATLQLQVLLSMLDIVKTRDKPFAAGGSTLTYTLAFTNRGNTTASNIFFSDTIPTNTTFIPNSVVVNGTSLPGTNPNPPSSIPISNIGFGSTTTLTFQVLINTTIPIPSTVYNSGTLNYNTLGTTTPLSSISNIVATTINAIVTLSSNKSVDKNYANCGDTITYTIVTANSGNVTANNVFLIDTIPNSTTLVPNSVIINGITQPGYNPSLGITMPDIAPSANSTVTFKVVIQC